MTVGCKTTEKMACPTKWEKLPMLIRGPKGILIKPLYGHCDKPIQRTPHTSTDVAALTRESDWLKPLGSHGAQAGAYSAGDQLGGKSARGGGGGWLPRNPMRDLSKWAMLLQALMAVATLSDRAWAPGCLRSTPVPEKMAETEKLQRSPWSTPVRSTCLRVFLN